MLKGFLRFSDATFNRCIRYGAWVSRNAAQPSRPVSAAEKIAGGKPKNLTESKTPTT
jgi:hypothetical protein